MYLLVWGKRYEVSHTTVGCGGVVDTNVWGFAVCVRANISGVSRRYRGELAGGSGDGGGRALGGLFDREVGLYVVIVGVGRVRVGSRSRERVGVA